MDRMVRLTVFFIDGTELVFEFAKQADGDAVTVAGLVKKALEMDRLVLEVDGDLVVIPGRNVKYITLSPGPDALPEGRIVRGARIVS